MSNNIRNPDELYELISNINKFNFKNKTVTIIGTGYMAEKYTEALKKFKIKNITIMGRTKKNVKYISDKFNVDGKYTKFEKNLLDLSKQDLVIIAVSVKALIPILRKVIDQGCQNILVEKPGSLYTNELDKINKKITTQNVRIAYNRIVYPNVILLKNMIEKDGGVSSCIFSITERPHLMKNIDKKSDVYQRWGISNSLHVISLVTEIIGMFDFILPIQRGMLDWHRSGSKFLGTGITSKEIPFSYHGDWESIGGWGITIFTKNHIFKLKPLEILLMKKRNSKKWKVIKFKTSFPKIKQGVSEEIFMMLHKDQTKNILPTIDVSRSFIEYAKKIFGYKK
jgi:hypothetical protein